MPADKSIRVLLADNQRVLIDGLETLVDAQPDMQLVGRAIDAAVALDLVGRLRPNVAIVAWNVPGLNGLEATRQISKRAPETSVLMLSMYAAPACVHLALRAGAKGYVVKDAPAAELLEAVRRVHDGRRYLSDAVSHLLIGAIAGEHDAAHDPLRLLSERELEVLRLTADGKPSAASAKLLGLSPKTVESYRSRIMRKLEIRNLAGLVKFAVRHGIASLD